jgi:hypothetical protein
LPCKYAPASGPLGCAPLPFTLGVDANYIGAAISPTGARMVWWTDVVDGGGGTFEYVVDYGGGWNGPRAGSAGGYDDASYINIAFGAGSDQGRFTMHVQLVSGLAPNWTFLGAVGSGDLGTTDPVSWQNVLARLQGTPSSPRTTSGSTPPRTIPTSWRGGTAAPRSTITRPPAARSPGRSSRSRAPTEPASSRPTAVSSCSTA